MTEATAERWLPIPGYEGQYEVSDLGRVRSVDRVVMRVTRYGGVGPRRFRGRLRKPWLTRTGYYQVRLVDDDPARLVHQLVLEAFVGPRPFDGAITRHLNGNPLDNRPSNLAWGTYLENTRDRELHGTLNQVACRRGHLLTEPNLATAWLARGLRRCLACDRARQKVRWSVGKGVPMDLDQTADACYADIMADAA